MTELIRQISGKKIIGVISLLLCVLLLIPGCEAPSCSGADLGDPRDALSGFVACMKNGNYSEAATFLDEKVSLDLENGFELTDSVVDGDMLEFLRQSYSVSFAKESYVSGTRAEVYFSFTYLDIDKMTLYLKELIDIEADYRSFNFGTNYSGDSALALELMEDVWNSAVMGRIPPLDGLDGKYSGEISNGGSYPVIINPSDYYVTKEMSVEMRWVQDGGWKLFMNNDFIGGIIGRGDGSIVFESSAVSTAEVSQENVSPDDQ